VPAPNPLLSRPLSETDEARFARLRAAFDPWASRLEPLRATSNHSELPRSCPVLAGLLGGRATLEDATSADTEHFIIHLIDAHSSTTASVRFKSLQQFYGWLTAEEWIARNPMAGLRAPPPREKPVPVLVDADLRALIAA
jgi:site-specific recombinase XerC